ncbi:hypothetical protein LJC08_00495 [Methanimicrococcus sp. OttesenSCG-928-J09]|nr:hypothetical protein [Methanimicrococcus sp. OttesenSCG-928-J09]
MSYISHLTQEQKRLYFSDFDAYFQNNQDLSPAETLYNYYSNECGYTPKEISQKTGRAYTTIQNTLQNVKKKQIHIEAAAMNGVRATEDVVAGAADGTDYIDGIEIESEDCEILSSADSNIQKLTEEQKIVRPFDRSDLASSLIEKICNAGISEENAAKFIRELTLGDLIKMVETNEIFIPLKYIEK